MYSPIFPYVSPCPKLERQTTCSVLGTAHTPRQPYPKSIVLSQYNYVIAQKICLSVCSRMYSPIFPYVSPYTKLERQTTCSVLGTAHTPCQPYPKSIVLSQYIYVIAQKTVCLSLRECVLQYSLM